MFGGVDLHADFFGVSAIVVFGAGFGRRIFLDALVLLAGL